ncbi:MAG: putative Ig domain-containing protein, partial [Snowella sp.]
NQGLITAEIVNNQLVLNFQPNQFGTAQITLRGSDNLDSVDSTFTVFVNSVNDFPILNKKIDNQIGTEGAAFIFQIPTDTFSDVEDAQLTYSLSPETKLPVGIVFDPIKGKFSGNLSDVVVGTYQITVIATDKDLAQVSTTFSLKIANANTAPVVKQALTSLNVDEDAPQQTLSLDNLFEDADGNAIVKTVFANSNQGLITAEIVNNQLVLNFQPNQFGTAQITLRGSDSLDSVDSNFTVVVKPVNDLPVVNQKIADQIGNEGGAFAFQIPTATFSDVEDSLLSYSLATDTKLPKGIAFDPVTGKFSGNLSDIVAGTYRITVIGTDKNLAQISTTFSLKIANTIEVDITDKVSQFGASKSADSLGHLSYDLRDFGGEVTSKIDDKTLKQTDALFHNLVGLYQVENAEGAILDTLDLNGNGLTNDLLNPEDGGYARTALSNAVNNFMLQLGAKGDAALNTDATEFGDVLLQGGKMYAPFAIANGGSLIPVGGTMQDGINAFLAQNPNNTAANLSDFMTHAVAYFSFGSANPDGTEHLQSRGNNVFGFEDLPGNLGISDMDFNDAVFKFTFTA